MKAWNNFKERHPKCVKTIKRIAVVGGAGIITFCGYKYIKHQPPMGNDSWRCHYRKDGKPKIKYSSKERANLQVVKDLVLHGTLMNSYKCRGCDGYHLGHKRKVA